MSNTESSPHARAMLPAPALSRRAAIRLGVGASVGLALAPLLPYSSLAAQSGPLILRAIPSSGEKLPVIGIGTARRFDVTTAEERAPLLETLRAFPTLGGKLIDTAPSYGQAEAVTGELVEQLGIRDALFLATKVSVRGSDTAPGVAQMNESFRKLRTDRIDLMQVWNLGGTEALLPVLRDMKAAKKIRYVGVTTSNESQYPALEALMAKEALDFIQVDYAADNREVAARILPMARDKGIAVLINLPFGRSRVFQNVLGTPVPEWSKEFEATTWAQVFLKYIAAHPAVTCVIPGTAQLKYVNDNMAAARGALPDAAMLKKIEAVVAKSM
jgi:aryl-alcohol dehydrogenase-like predicted oxidoreductase